MLDGFHHHTLDVGIGSQMFQPVKNQWMMADDQVTVFCNGFIHQLFCHIQGYQGFTDFSIEISHLNAGIVIMLLPLQRCYLRNTI